MFNKKLAERVKQSGWMEAGANIIMIPESTVTPRHLITEYGRLTIENIEAKIQNFIGKQTRQSQKSVQLFHYLTNSITESVNLKIVVDSTKYIDDETPLVELLFKLTIRKSIIDTLATDIRLRENFTNLYTYMTTVDFEIENLNQYVKFNVNVLKARGYRTDDLMNNLFKAYQVASDGEFFICIHKKRDQYDEGNNTTK